MTAGRPHPDPEAVRALYRRLRTDAALRDAFRPAETLAALPGGLPDDDLMIVAALSALREDSTVTRDAGGQIWTLRPAVRRKVLETITEAELEGHDSAIWQALTGTAGYQPEAIQRLLRYAQTGRPPPAQVLARRLFALERAGPQAPAYDLIVALRSALNAAEQRARATDLLSGGVFGREAEQARIAAWIAKPQHKAPLRCLHVSGLPGIGKSYLLQHAVQTAGATGDGPLTVWLDFDRSGLGVADATAFFEEVSRQIGDALPTIAVQLRDIRLQAARARSSLSASEAAHALPRHLLSAMGKLVRAQNRPVLIVLDTLEVLRARGETAVMRLFEHLDILLSEGVAPLCVISAGRGDALDPVPDRCGERVILSGLPDAAADTYLAAQNVPEPAWDAIRRMAGGNPLLLKLGARAHADGLSPEAAPETPMAGPDMAGAYLYRAILSRLDPPLNALAQAGLVLHRIRPGHLHDILAPALDLSMTEAQAGALFHDLATQHWLVEADSGGGWLRHRADIRAAFLPLLYADQPALAYRVNARAAAVLEPTDPAAALYHRLQLTRGLPGLAAVDGELPEIDPLEATQLGATMIDELPAPARDALRRARGERSDNFRAGVLPDGGAGAEIAEVAPAARTEKPAQSGFALDRATGRLTTGRLTTGRLASGRLTNGRFAATRLSAGPPRQPRPLDPRLIDDLRLMLTEGDRREAAYLVDKALANPFAAEDPGAVVVLAYLWVSGAWASAVRLWRAMGAPFDDPDPSLTRLLREIDAEARFVTATRRLPDLSAPPASGRSALLGSAYDVALVMRDAAAEAAVAGEGRPRAAALLAPWLPEAEASAVARLRDDSDLRRERIGLTLSAQMPAALRPGLAIAPLMPHLAPLSALAMDRTGQARAEWLAALAERLPEILHLQAPWVGLEPETLARAAERPFEMLDLLAACGLLPEAATALALSLRDAEIARLAVSAERWRRLSHGLWSLSARPPRGWQGRAGLDAVTQRLLAMPPQDAARLARLWLPAASARQALARRLRGRMPQGDAEARALAALRRDLPPGLAVPAALSTTDEFD